MGNTGICALCGLHSQLCFSHIIPDFLYDGVYDGKHRAIGIKNVPGARTDTLQQGLREYLLCQVCETRFSKLEKYAAEIFRGLPDFSAARPSDIIRTKADYKVFKLFQLSVLWRMGVSTLPSFSAVVLGPHEETIRKMLLSDAPGDPLDYGCVYIRTHGSTGLETIMRPPISDRFDSHQSYLCILGGLIWVFIVSKHSKSLKKHGSFLSVNGNLPIHISGISTEEHLREFGKHLKAAGLL